MFTFGSRQAVDEYTLLYVVIKGIRQAVEDRSREARRAEHRSCV